MMSMNLSDIAILNIKGSKMGKMGKIIIFGDIEIQKQKFHQQDLFQ